METSRKSRWKWADPEDGRRAGRWRRTAIVLLLVLGGLLLGGLARPAGAAWESASIFGADIRSLAVLPADPEVVLAGTSGGHVYLSRNGGETWEPAGSHLPFPGWVVGTLLFDPNRPERLWAGLWGLWGGGLVAYSEDLGRSWVVRADGLPEEPVYALAAAPGIPGRLYAGTRSGVYGTDDEGRTWRHLTAPHPEILNVSSLLVDPFDPRTVIAGTWRRAYRSRDGGATWHGVFQGMVLDTDVFSLHPVHGQPREVWASTCGWVYRTQDMGDRWVRYKEGLDEQRTPSFQVLSTGRLLAGTIAGVYASDDGGRSWKRQSDPDLMVSALAHHPARPERVIVGTEGDGIWISTDGASTFRRASAGLTNVRIGVLLGSGRDILVAVNHAGPSSGIYRSRDGGRSFELEFPGIPTVLDLATDGLRIFAATERGLFERYGPSWRLVGEMGPKRVEEVVAAYDRVVARTPTGLFEEREGRFVPLPFHHGLPRSAAVYQRALWVADAQGLYRLTEEENHTVDTPFPGGRMTGLEDRLVFFGRGGIWIRTDLASPWWKVTGQAARALPTGDRTYSLVVLGEEGAYLYRGETGSEKGLLQPLELPVPHRDVTSALVAGGRLWLGTSGHGLWSRRLARIIHEAAYCSRGSGRAFGRGHREGP